MIKVVVWNIRGLNNASKQNDAFMLLKDGNYSVCSFIETHVVKDKLIDVCSRVYGSWNWLSNNACNDDWTRVIVGWDPNSESVNVLDQSSQVIHCLIRPTNGHPSFFCSFIYGSTKYVIRRELWD